MFICFLISYHIIHGCYKKYLFIESLFYVISPLACLLNQMNVIHCLKLSLQHTGDKWVCSVKEQQEKMVWECSPHHKYVSSIFSCCGRKMATNTWTVNHLAWNMFKYECSSWKMKSMEFWHPLWLLRDEQLGYAKKEFLD